MGIEREAQQVAESEIRGQDHETLRPGILEDYLVRLSAQANVANVFDFEAFSAKQRR